MSIEQHSTSDPAPVETGADLARLLDGLTRTLLDLPAVEPVVAVDPVQAVEPQVTPVVPEPRPERRGNVLNELGFLDD